MLLGKFTHIFVRNLKTNLHLILYTVCNGNFKRLNVIQQNVLNQDTCSTIGGFSNAKLHIAYIIVNKIMFLSFIILIPYMTIFTLFADYCRDIDVIIAFSVSSTSTLTHKIMH